ncbi:hypothetical protein A1D24_10725 [Testudinibacter aquarius]|nr:hypothetical protein A1D24_10725 [Testudinibacter aquarius]
MPIFYLLMPYCFRKQVERHDHARREMSEFREAFSIEVAIISETIAINKDQNPLLCKKGDFAAV